MKNRILTWAGAFLLIGIISAFPQMQEIRRAAGSGGGGGSAPAGTVINSGNPVTTAIPTYSGTTGTNITPSSLTVGSLTNLMVPGTVTGYSGVFSNMVTFQVSALSASGTNVAVDFSGPNNRTLSISTNALFSASNLAAGRTVTIRLLSDSTTRGLYWNASWIPIGAPLPGSIAASKYAEVELKSWGTTDADVTVKYAEQP